MSLRLNRKKLACTSLNTTEAHLNPKIYGDFPVTTKEAVGGVVDDNSQLDTFCRF